MHAVWMNSALALIIGAVLLFFGRKLFWLFVGVAGFLAGMDIAGRFVSGPDAAKLIIALLIGIIGAFLAVIFYRVAVAIAGFFIGGYLAIEIASYLGLSVPQSLWWIPYLIGGIVGAVLILLLLDWALIVLSSFAGASMIVHAITLRQFNEAIVYIVLAILGILVQAGILLRSRQVKS